MSRTLRPYQVEALGAIDQQLESHQSTLLVQATGTGKTVVFTKSIASRLAHGRVMILVDRQELIDQAYASLRVELGIDVPIAIEQAENRSVERDGFWKAPIVIAMIQTLRSGQGDLRRWSRFDPNEFAFLVIDEADLAIADSYMECMQHFRHNERLKFLGVTATPDRHDGQAMGQLFESVAYEYNIDRAVADGWLVPIAAQYLDVVVNLDGCKKTLGDLNKKDLRLALAQGDTLEQIACGAIQHAGERRTLVFSDSVENAERLTVEFNRHRLGNSRIVTGETPKDERKLLIEDYRSGQFQFLVNVGVATRGFDVPEIACLVLARPTCSRNLFTQMIGRGTRTLAGVVDGLDESSERVAAIEASGKPELLILDVVCNTKKHDICHVTDVLGGDYTREEKDIADRLMRDLYGPMRAGEALEEARRRRNVELEEEARQRAESVRMRQVAVLEERQIVGTDAYWEWHGDRMPNGISKKQFNVLKRWGGCGLARKMGWTAEEIAASDRWACKAELDRIFANPPWEQKRETRRAFA